MFKVKVEAKKFRVLFEQVNKDCSKEEYVSLTMTNLDFYAEQYFNLTNEIHNDKNCNFIAWAIINKWF